MIWAFTIFHPERLKDLKDDLSARSVPTEDSFTIAKLRQSSADGEAVPPPRLHRVHQTLGSCLWLSIKFCDLSETYLTYLQFEVSEGCLRTRHCTTKDARQPRVQNTQTFLPSCPRDQGIPSKSEHVAPVAIPSLVMTCSTSIAKTFSPPTMIMSCQAPRNLTS